MRFASFFLVILAALSLDLARAEPATEPADLLGPEFSSRSSGLAFRPPRDSVESHPGTPNTIVEFDSDDAGWQLKAWRVRLERSQPLTAYADQFGTQRDGLLEDTVRSLQATTPGAQLLRNEVINVGRTRVGMIAIRYETATHERRLTQQALVEAPDTNQRLYYVLELSSPGKSASEAADSVNPAEQRAADTFAKVVDSITLLDRKAIVEEQEQRLYQTRALFVTWLSDHAAPLRAAIVPEQYQRILQNGKDVGYRYIVEELEAKGKSPEEGILHIGVRSHMLDANEAAWDTVNWFTCSLDRTHETWTSSSQLKDTRGQITDSLTQLATSDEQTKPIVLQPKSAPDGSLTPDSRSGPLGQGNVDIQTVRTLEISTNRGPVVLDQFKQDVPAFYIPQAINFLLPELMSINRPHTYLFAVFVPTRPGHGERGAGQVVARYVDVLPIQEAHFNGQAFQAAQVVDRIGLEGEPTTHFLTVDGKYVGSSGREIVDGQPVSTMVIPTDAESLGHLWNHPDFSVPKGGLIGTPRPATP